MKNRLVLSIACIMILMTFHSLASENEGVKMAQNLKASIQLAKIKGIPVLLFFAAEDCPYCERLEGDYLHAMANSLDYKSKILIRKVVIDSYDEFLDFNGKNIEASDFSDKFNIQVTPTLVFLNHKGQSITQPIIGYNGSAFFGAELDDAILLATNKLK